MLNVIDALVRDLLLRHITQLSDESQVGFQPPDDAWRTFVSTLSVGGNPANALNVYLVDVVENRKLRSNERVRSVVNGSVSEEPLPARVDCHYLVSAWSPATATPQITPTLDEHVLLYEALAAFMQNEPINASRIYPPGSAALLAVPELIRDADLPTEIAHEGFTKLPEFWGTMGPNNRWKPVIHLVVTVPVQLLVEFAGPMVTTRITEYRISGVATSADIVIQIGGHVRDATQAPAAPLAGAWVQIQTPAGEPIESLQTNGLGRFTFGGLTRGQYRLETRAGAFAPLQRLIDVPSASGEYDLEFV